MKTVDISYLLSVSKKFIDLWSLKTTILCKLMRWQFGFSVRKPLKHRKNVVKLRKCDVTSGLYKTTICMRSVYPLHSELQLLPKTAVDFPESLAHLQ